MKASCTKGYNNEVFLGEDEIYKASTRAMYLCLSQANIRYEDKLPDTIEKMILIRLLTVC